MNGLIEVKDIITETGYFYDYECMDIADLRDEYIVFVSFWDHESMYLYSEEEKKNFPNIDDVFDLGIEIERIGKDKLSQDFRDTLEYIKRMKHIKDLTCGKE